jgi:hypothetical protein
MKKTFIVLLVLAALYFVFMRELARSQRRTNVVNTVGALQSAFADLKQNGNITNRWPNSYRIFNYTNHYSIAGKEYQCVLAADSWDYRGASNLLALTTNRVFLFINQQDILLLTNSIFPPGF